MSALAIAHFHAESLAALIISWRISSKIRDEWHLDYDSGIVTRGLASCCVGKGTRGQVYT